MAEHDKTKPLKVKRQDGLTGEVEKITATSLSIVWGDGTHATVETDGWRWDDGYMK